MTGPLPQSQHVEYRYERVAPGAATGELSCPRTGEGYRSVIDASAIDGWRFVQAIPAGPDGSREFDLVFERVVRYPVLVFGHLPKSAGTSVTAMLIAYLEQIVGVNPSHWLQYGAAIPYEDLRPLRQLAGRVRLVTGHFGPDHYQLLLRNDAFVLVSIRDPFERFLSVLEHEQRDASACPSNAAVEAIERYQRLRAGIEGIQSGRGDAAAMRGALEALRGDYISVSQFLRFAGRNVAQAWIGTDQVDEFRTRLAATAPDPVAADAILGRHARENVFAKRLFQDFSPGEQQLLRTAFEEVFADECDLLHSVERDAPNLFTTAAWAAFLGCLWRKPGLA